MPPIRSERALLRAFKDKTNVPGDSAFVLLTPPTQRASSPFNSILDGFTDPRHPRDFLRDVTPEKSSAAAHGFTYVRNRTYWDLMDEMLRKDSTLSRVVRLTISHVLRRDSQFAPDDPEDEASVERAAFIEDVVTNCDGPFGWCQYSEVALRGAMQHGVSGTQMVLDEHRFAADGVFAPIAFMHAHPGQFVYDVMGKPFLVGSSANTQPIEIDYGKFSFMRMPSLYASPYGESVLDDLIALYWFKKEVLKAWLYFSDVYGHPLIIVTPGEGQKMLGDMTQRSDELKAIINNMSREFGIVLAYGEKVEIKDRSGGQRADLHEKIVKWINTEIVKYILGSLLATEEAEFGSRAQAKEHGHQTDIRIGPLAKIRAEAITRDILRPLTRWNFGPDVRSPSFVTSLDEPADIKAFTDMVTHAVDYGIDVEAEQYREITGLDVPQEGAQKLVKQTPAAPVVDPPMGADELDDEDARAFSKKKSSRYSRASATGQSLDSKSGSPSSPSTSPLLSERASRLASEPSETESPADTDPSKPATP